MSEEVGKIRGVTESGAFVWSTYAVSVSDAVNALATHWHIGASGVHVMKRNKAFAFKPHASPDQVLGLFRDWLQQIMDGEATTAKLRQEPVPLPSSSMESHLKQQLEKEQARCVELHRCVEELQTKLAGLEAVHEAMKVKPEYAYTQVPTLLLGRIQVWGKRFGDRLQGSELSKLLDELEPYFPKSEEELRRIGFQQWARQHGRNYLYTVQADGKYEDEQAQEAYEVWCLFTQANNSDQ